MEVKDKIYHVRKGNNDEKLIQVRKNMKGYWQRYVDIEAGVMRFVKVGD